VLEDEPLIRDVLEAHLTRGGYTVYAVGTIEEAEEILNMQDIGCIVSDVVLGDRAQDNGIAFCKSQVQQGYSNAVVIISGFIPEESAILPPGWLFLSKPFRGAELMACISKVLPLSETPS
jgi:DNA-binding response OmpR family regulator